MSQSAEWHWEDRKLGGGGSCFEEGNSLQRKLWVTEISKMWSLPCTNAFVTRNINGGIAEMEG